MIDGPTYRLSERLARSRSPSWMLKNTQSVPFAEGGSFPRGFDSNSQLAELIDIFHEGFFEPFIDEWFGLTRDQFASLVDALTDCLLFQKKSFPANRPLVPFASMAAQFSIYEKLIRIDPTFGSVAEIGPGAGYLAFFLRNHPSLELYDAVESAEGFYVYQSMIYDHCFPLRHDERALPPGLAAVADFHAVKTPYYIDDSPEYIDFNLEPVCTHHPWWRLGELISSREKYDVVVSNANLAEIHQGAFATYIDLIPKLMKEDGYFHAQCLGGPVCRSLQEVEEALFRAGLAPLMFFHAGHRKPIPWRPEIDKSFAKGQCIAIRKGHPLFERLYRREHFASYFIADHPICRAIMDPPSEPTVRPSRADFVAAVRERLAGRIKELGGESGEIMPPTPPLPKSHDEESRHGPRSNPTIREPTPTPTPTPPPLTTYSSLDNQVAEMIPIVRQLLTARGWQRIGEILRVEGPAGLARRASRLYR